MTRGECLLSLTLLAAAGRSGQGQGCTQCRDNTAAAPPATQRAYRHAISLLGLTGATVFAGTLIVMRRNH